ncbi:hypothetical protein MBLNU13_g10674t1 [Cladosporium sp. NU13]
MAHNLLTHGTAHYLHATLEQFNRVAVQEVIRRFEGVATTIEIGPGPYSLRYDERDHVFSLNCQSHVGVALNEKLGHIIRDYVASGASTVKRFAECDTEDLFCDDEEELEEEVSPPLVDTLPPDIHVANFDGINPSGKAKTFRLKELPHALGIRAKNRCENLANAISFRRVRWDQSSEKHLFDGSVGQKLPELSKEERSDFTTLLEILAFSEFTAKITIPTSRDPEPGLRYFESVGERPTVSQWLEGTGNARQVDPEDEPEMHGDAQRFASGLSLQPNTLGRVRKPLGMDLSELREPETAIQSERSEEQINNSFAALMKSDANDDSDTESSETSSDEASIIEGIKPGTIAELVGAASDLSVAEELTQPSDWSAIDNGADAALVRATTGRGRAGGVLAAGQKPLQPEESFPKYDKSYANVDGVGLCGDAVNQVNWENENAIELWTRRNNSAPRTYELLALSRAESVTKFRQAGRHPQSTPITSITPMSYAETPLGGDEPWANNIVAPTITVPTGTLISTNESVNGDGRSKTQLFPPGLFPPLGSSGKQQIKKPKASAARMGNSSTKTSSNAMITQPASHHGSKYEEAEELLMAFDDDNLPPIERLQPQQEASPRLYHTMRQQASKNKNQKKKPRVDNSKTGVPRPANLELASQLPAPKPRRETKSSELQKQRHHAKSVQPVEPTSLVRLQQAIVSLLESSSHDHDAGKPDIVIQFGLALMTNAEKLAASKALRCVELQNELDKLSAQRTTFLTALGRKNRDGVYLLRLPTTLPGSESPYAGSSQLTSAWTDGDEYGIIDRRLYEITIVAPGGREWRLVFDHNTPEDVQFTLADVNQQSVYVHYPMRVWDARVQLLPAAGSEPESAFKSKIMTFLKTLDTPKASDDERPFFEATMPDAAFRVANVTAKRVLTTKLRSGTWKVTQACDLHMKLNRGSVTAYGKLGEIMEQEGRIWWEAALQYDGREDFGTTLNEIMERLDDVGFEPEPESKTLGKAKVSDYVAFW